MLPRLGYSPYNAFVYDRIGLYLRKDPPQSSSLSKVAKYGVKLPRNKTWGTW